MPFSCAAWIHSIHRGVDVARASGLAHIAGATGTSSEAAVQRLHGLPDAALIEMGDFVGGMLKYLKQHPVPSVTIAGGFAKMTKLGQGLLDLHSKRGRVDNEWLAGLLQRAGGSPELCAKAREANTAQHVLELAREADAQMAARLGELVAEAAWTAAARVLEGSGIALDVAVFDRAGAWSEYGSENRSFRPAPEPPLIGSVVQGAFAKILRAKRLSHQDKRRAFDCARRRDLLHKFAERRADDFLLGPTRPVNNGGGTICAIEGQKLGDRFFQNVDREVDGERGAGRREGCKRFSGRHRGRAA